MTHPGVGPLTALAFVLVIGSTKRFACGKQIGSYLGLIPCEDSSANRQRLGHISKQVAMARKLAVSLFWMWRKEWNYDQVAKFGSHAGESEHVHGVQ